MFNDDCRGFNDLLIWAFSGIRANYQPYSARQNQWLFVDTRSSILANHCSDSPVIAQARGPFVPWMGVAVSETRAALADGDHYREMAGKLREQRFPEILGHSRHGGLCGFISVIPFGTRKPLICWGRSECPKVFIFE
jgi:hypothetical protein